MDVRRLIASTATAAVLAGGGLSVAALNPLSSAGAAEEQPAARAGGDDTPARAAEGDSARGRHRLHRLRRGAVKVASDAIGIPPGQLVSSLRQGSSIAQVAEANEVDPRAVVDALVAAATERVEQALADGRIDEERAARILDRLPEAMAKVVDRVPQTPRPND